MNENQDKELIKLIRNMDSIKEQLKPWLDNNNIFKILKIDNFEIRHSEFLSYLMDPSNGYGWKDEFLKKFLIKIIDKDTNNNFTIDEFDIILKDFNDIKVYREKWNIDILLVSEKRNLVLCIENKIWSTEHDEQLNRYQKIINNTFDNFDIIYIYLSPNGEQATSETWISIGYDVVLDTCKIMFNNYKNNIDTNLKILLEDYIEVLDGGIVVNDDLSNKCNEIYYKYKDAFDLIYENRIDPTIKLMKLYKEALVNLESEGFLINYIDELITNKYIRFSTQYLDNFFTTLDSEIFPVGWNSRQYIRYEITDYFKASKTIVLAIGKQFLNNDQNEFINSIFRLNNDNKKINQNWPQLPNQGQILISEELLNNLMFNFNSENNDNAVNVLKESLQRVHKTLNNNLNNYFMKTF